MDWAACKLVPDVRLLRRALGATLSRGIFMDWILRQHELNVLRGLTFAPEKKLGSNEPKESKVSENIEDNKPMTKKNRTLKGGLKMKSEINLNSVLNENELLEILGTKKSVLDRLRYRGQFPFCKVSHSCRVYLAADVLGWLKEHRLVLNKHS
jgi:hypothetical protein